MEVETELELEMEVTRKQNRSREEREKGENKRKIGNKGSSSDIHPMSFLEPLMLLCFPPCFFSLLYLPSFLHLFCLLLFPMFFFLLFSSFRLHSSFGNGHVIVIEQSRGLREF